MSEMKRFVSSSRGPTAADVAELCGSATVLVNTDLEDQGIKSYQGTCYVESGKVTCDVLLSKAILYCTVLYYIIPYPMI